MITTSYVTYNDILADALLFSGDTEYKKGLTPGFYKRQIQVALEDLAMSTYFDKKHTCDKDMPANLIGELPEGVYDLQQVFIYNGTIKDPSSLIPVVIKFGETKSKGSTRSFSKRSNVTGNNEFFPSGGSRENTHYSNSAVYTCSEQNGSLIFSSMCSGYSFYRVVYDGFGSKIDEIPIIPRVFRQAVIDYVTVRSLRAQLGRNKGDKQIGDLYTTAQASLVNTWPTAVFRANRMSKLERDSMTEYFRGIQNMYG